MSEPRHETETQDMSAGIRTPRSNMRQGTQTRERTARADSKPEGMLVECKGSILKVTASINGGSKIRRHYVKHLADQ